MQRRVSLSQILQVLIGSNLSFILNTNTRRNVCLFRVIECKSSFLCTSLTNSSLGNIIPLLQIGLNNVSLRHTTKSGNLFSSGLLDEELALNFLGDRFTQQSKDFFYDSAELAVKISRIVKHSQVRMANPGIHRLVIRNNSLFGRLSTSGIIASIRLGRVVPLIILLSALRSSYQVKNCIVTIKDIRKRHISLFEQLLEYGILIRVGTTIHDTSIVKYDELILVKIVGRHVKDVFIGNLGCEDEILEFIHVDFVAGSDTIENHVSCSLRYRNYLIASFFERLSQSGKSFGLTIY